jgi:hypothetical protein
MLYRQDPRPDDPTLASAPRDHWLVRSASMIRQLAPEEQKLVQQQLGKTYRQKMSFKSRT